VRRRPVDLATQVGSVALPAPVLTASGTAGFGTELAGAMDLGALGAVVVKSLAHFPWPGNEAPRVVPTPAGMLNAVGLQGPGVAAWRDQQLPALVAGGARVVASIWGRTVEEFGRAAAELAGAPGVLAVEVNVSCPNVEDRRRMFAHSARATAEAVEAAGAAGLPRWAKLSPNVPDVVEIAGAALAGGAEGLVLVNTVLGMAIDPARRAYRLGSGPAGGGLSGPAIRPIAVRAVHDVRAAFPTVGIVGVGGVASGRDAAELLCAGADAVEVGTATFADPGAPLKVLLQLVRWCRRHRVQAIRDLVGSVHRSSAPSSVEAPPGAEAAPADQVGRAVAATARDPGDVAPPVAPGPDDGSALLAAVRAQLDALDQGMARQTEEVARLGAALAKLAEALLAAGEQPAEGRGRP
jgi:dihydroorotate dehydrogenase (NAD+) catalytic subunit